MDEILDASISNSKDSIAITTGGSDPSGVFFKIWELLEGTNIHATFLIEIHSLIEINFQMLIIFLDIIDYDIEHISFCRNSNFNIWNKCGRVSFFKKPVIS